MTGVQSCALPIGPAGCTTTGPAGCTTTGPAGCTTTGPAACTTTGLQPAQQESTAAQGSAKQVSTFIVWCDILYPHRFSFVLLIKNVNVNNGKGHLFEFLFGLGI